MAKIGINFRATSGGPSGFPGDGTDETPNLGSTTPTVFNGFTHWWSSFTGGSSRDRSGSTDRRVGGINFAFSLTPTFSVTLIGTGAHTIRLACGDQANDSGHESVNMKDGGTSFHSWDKAAGTTGANKYWDADGTTERTSDTDWASNNASVSRTFTSVNATFEFGDAINLGEVAHLFIEEAGGGGGTTRGMPFGARGTAFNGGRTLQGIIR